MPSLRSLKGGPRPAGHCLAATAAAVLLSLAIVPGRVRAADPVFSGPQPGEKATPFRVVDITGPSAGSERPVSTAGTNPPTVLVFIHGIERSLVPLLRTLDDYGATNRSRLRTELVFLAADRLSGEQRVKAAAHSLRLRSPVGLSPDGAEGPGNYGLNKDCLMTVVAARDQVVATNFALVQPGIADAPRIVAALAALCGDPNPPTAESLLAAGARGRDGAMGRGATNRMATGGPDPFPGAVPTDEKLQGLLRRFIRPTNDPVTVDAVLAEVKAHLATDLALKQQAIDGWTRVLHFGDRYGNEYSRQVGREFLDSLKGP